MSSLSPRTDSDPGAIHFGEKSLRKSQVRKDRWFSRICVVAAGFSVVILSILLLAIGVQGYEHLDFDLLNAPPSREAARAGIGPAMWGTLWVCAICGMTAIPIGVCTAVLLEEFKPKHRFIRMMHSFFEINISNLAGVPSIIYGIVGLTVFVQFWGVAGNSNEPGWTIGVSYVDTIIDESGEYISIPIESRDAPETVVTDGMNGRLDSGETVSIRVMDADGIAALPADELTSVVLEAPYIERMDSKSWYYMQIPFGRGVFAGGLTLMLVILPIVIISSQEALRAVPDSLREASFGLGSTRWQMVSKTTLPAAIPGIMTGAILAISRAIGEAAPVLIIAGIVYIRFTPQNLMDDFTVMPLQIYDWAGRPNSDFHHLAASGIIVLLAILLAFNATAVFIRHKFQKPLS